jgi:predicted LPLAT superfamily acyltransferase
VTVAWRAQKERGNRVAIRFMAWVALRFGRPVARLFLYPVCVYYTICSRQANKALRTFYVHAAGRPPAWRHLYRHYHCFASTILDRVYFLRGRFDLFKVTVHGLGDLDRLLSRGHGCLLLGSHLGSFEAVRAVGLARKGIEIRVVMDEENSPLLRGLIEELSPAVAATVIQVGGPATMLEVKECLNRGGVVGVMGDRVMKEDQAANCLFMEKLAPFPTGAIRLAHAVQAPVVLFFGLYRGGNRYDVYFESFSDQVCLSSEPREADLGRWVQRYADRLAVYCRHTPDNWFNFYEFWSRPS